MTQVLTNTFLKRERSRSPRRRSRSPRRSRRSYTPRSRSRSREDYRRSDRRSRSPMTGAPGAYSGSSYSRGGAPLSTRSFEERAQAKEQMMASVRESSQQERRVYVGNLSYDVKWHHLKDFMRQGTIHFADSTTFTPPLLLTRPCSRGGPLCRCVVTSEWNVEGGRQHVDMAGLSGFLLVVGRWIDGLGHCPRVM